MTRGQVGRWSDLLDFFGGWVDRRPHGMPTKVGAAERGILAKQCVYLVKLYGLSISGGRNAGQRSFAVRTYWAFDVVLVGCLLGVHLVGI